MTTAAIVSKVWSCCNVLRYVGVSYGDYPERFRFENVAADENRGDRFLFSLEQVSTGDELCVV